LEALRAMLSSWGGEKTAVDDLTILTSLLKQFDEFSVEEFCRLVAQNNKESGAKSVRSAAAQPDEILVSAYLGKLRDALSDRVKFMSVTSEMRVDKSLKLAELTAIGSQLANIEREKTKKLALDAIVSWAHRRFDTERRRRETSGLF
jgi:hypothetical protein